MSGELSVVLRESRLLVTIDRPHKANTLTAALVSELTAVLGRAGAEAGIRVVTLRGSGDRVFCGGFDLDELDAGRGAPGLAELMALIRNLPVPTIALLNGHAVGAGLELASSCDLRIAVRGARVGLPAIRLAVPYRAEGMAAVLNASPALRKLLLTGEQASVESIPGFGDALVEPSELESVAERWCAAIAGASPEVVSYTVRLIRSLATGGLDGEAEDRFNSERSELIGRADFRRSVAEARAELTDPGRAVDRSE